MEIRADAKTQSQDSETYSPVPRSQMLPGSQAGEKFNPRTRKDAEKMSHKEKMDAGYKGKTYTTPMEWMEIFNVLVSIGSSISACPDITMENPNGWILYVLQIAKQKFEDANPIQYNY